MTRRKQLSSQLMHEVLTAPAQQLQAIPSPQERKTDLQNLVVYSALLCAFVPDTLPVIGSFTKTMPAFSCCF